MARNKGFTLLEVLLAITVLGMVFAMLSLSLSGTLKVVEITGKQEEMYHQVQIALHRICEDLAATVLNKEAAFAGIKSELEGRRADTLVFASLAHLILNPDKQRQGVAVIRYQLQADAEDIRRLKLLRSDTLLLPTGENSAARTEDSPFLLADNLRSVRFTYFNQQGQEFDSWEEVVNSGEQDNAAPLPAAVHCTLEFWLDLKKETFQTFSTGVLIPASLIATGGQG
jgi:general secretion pathway protein J